ncbi:dihydropteroate synthase [Sporosarcina sp. FA9]|uniref:dihydropteroate synthase n=1 Tax=Sporosarcina sp. FA9 TaxID=3413030 RepID=UPI003F65ADA8
MKLTFAKDVYQFGKTSMDFRKETVIMGILNVTPDSFSDGGKYARIEMALQHAREMIRDGAKIIDVGGESTRPGHTPVSIEEELERIVPIIEALTKDLGCAVSIDTYKSDVAEAAIKAGAHIINDVWGAKRDPEISYIAAKYNVPIILMHNREKAVYEGSFMNEVLKDLTESIDTAKKAGVSNDNIWLDPGVGFAKNTKQNIQVMQGLGEISQLGYPVLLGTSRKSVIGNVLGLPVNERLEGTGATVCYGIEHGSHIMRVHDVKEIVRISKMMDVLTGKSTYEE